MNRNKYRLSTFLLVVCALVVCSCETKCVNTEIADIDNADTIVVDTDTFLSDSLTAQAEDRILAVPVGRFVGSDRVSANNPTTIAVENVTLLIDSGAVSRDVEISILATTEEHSGDIPDHLANLTANGAVYRMLPDGQQFERDITIAMRYDSTALPYGYTADDIYTFFFNEQTQMWQQVERDSVDTQNQIVYSRTNHFTDYINGVLKMPESSDAMAYTPTSIKDLKAADPIDGITLIAPPEANIQGTANLTYPLTIPAGRHGMQPQLAVTYNSAGGSGILGLGWSLPISEISVDTRRGVPLFSDSLETETYTLDGEVLVTAYTDGYNLLHLNKPAYSTQWKARTTSNTQRFYPRVEGAFRRIVRHGTSPKNYYWVVTDKNGVKYFYGESDNSRLKDDSGNIARWSLSRIEDTYENIVLYSYETHTHTATGNTNASRQLLISNINYTYHRPTDLRGRYDVRFRYADSAKCDAVNSARFGFLESDAALLDRIEVLFEDRPVKFYYFGYKKGAFGRTLLCNIIEADPDVASSGCTDCSGTTNTGYNDYHNPDFSFCGNAQYFDSISNLKWMREREFPGDTFLYPDTIAFFDICTSDTIDYYSDLGVKGDTLDTPVFSRDVYSRCSAMDTTCVHPAYTEHRFSYSSVPPIMLSATDYIKNEDSEQDNLRGPLFLVKGSPGPIEGSGTRSWNVGGAVDAGFGLNTFLKSITLGGSYSYSKSHSEGLVSLIDLNGDGLSDKIYKRDGNIYYRLRDNVNHNRFLSEQIVEGIPDFLHSVSTGNSWGVEGSVGTGGQGVCFGFNWSDGNSTTTTYFSDMDGDGLPDLVQNGQVFYNRIYDDEVNVFQPAAEGVEYVVVSSCGRSDTIYIGETVDPWVFSDFVDSTRCDTTFNKDGEIVDIECYTYTVPRPYEPNIENVRFWQAPDSGFVHITDSARMLPSSMVTGDGVRLLVQYNNQIVNCDTLLPNVDTSFLDTVIYVTEGQRIYFRVLSMDTRTADRVMWNPTIAYCDEHGNTEGWVDTNSVGQDKYRYSYENDFLLSGLQKIKMPFAAKVHIEATAYDRTNNPPLHDTYLKVLVNGDDSLSLFIGADPNFDSITLSLQKEDSIQVRIVADDSINWSNIESQCRIYFTENNATDEDSLFACIDTLSYEDSTIYFFDYYPQIQKLVYSWHNVIDTVYMYGDYDSSYAKFGTMYRHWGQFAYKAPASSSGDILQESLLYATDLASLSEEGESTYSGMNSNVQLVIDGDSQEDTARIGNHASYNPLASSFFVMQPDFKHNCWYAYSDYAYIERGMLSNLPHAADGLTISQIDSTDYESSMPIYTPGAVAVSKKSFNKSFGVSGNLNVKIAGIGWSGSASFTKSESRQLADMLDLNGDGLPDVLSEVRVQYTQPFGGLSAKTGTMFIDGLYSEYSLDTIYGGSFGGSALHMLWQPANNTRRSSKSISGSVGANVGNTRGSGNCATSWVDINGDGLPDKVYCNGGNLYYYQNVGYGFLPRALFSDGTVRHSTSLGNSGGTSLGASFERTWLNKEGAMLDELANGLPDELDTLRNRLLDLLNHQKYNNRLNVSITAGFGSSYSENTTDVLTIDLNGDGLPDRLEKHGNVYYIQFNNGNGFEWSNALLHVAKDIDNISYTTDLTGAVTAGVTFGFIPLKIEGNPKGGLSRSLSRTEAQWSDMNGDGIPDYIWDAGDGYIGVRYSRLGEANRLTSVTLPSGGTYQMTYTLNDDGSESNMRHYVMSSLTVKDNRIQAPDQNRRFQYASRYYDRIEREDYGYAEVVTIEDSTALDGYRRTVQQYHNQDYLFRGLCHGTTVIDGSSQDTLSASRQEYRLFEIVSGNLVDSVGPGCYGDGFPAVLTDSTLYYDGGQRQIVSRLRFGYTCFGNIDTVWDDGALNDPSDDYVAATHYDSIGDYIVSIVTDERVTAGGTLYRRRHADYCPTGDIQTLTFHNNASADAVYDFKYDDYGNIDTIFYPENHQGQRFFVTYKYDSETHSLATETSNAYNLTSYATYDHRWQKPVWTESVNGAQSKYCYDSQGRLTELYAPFEYSTGHPTIRNEYYDRYPQTDAFWRHCRLWARTLNDNNGANYIGTVTISDGLGRPRIVKKEAAVGGQPMRIVSGYTELDALGRKVREYHPDMEALSTPDSTFNSPLSTLNSQLFYDRIDRVTKTVYPDGTFSTSDYTVAGDADSILRLEVEVTDQNGHTSYIFSNVHEQNTTTIDPLGSTTVFHYDHVGQLQESIDPEGHSTYHAYDMLGRRTDRTHPSAGHTRWDYDPAGNILRQTQNDGQWIEYYYEYNRPVHIKYSDRTWNNVWYKYGSSGTEAGRVVCQQDATGVQQFHYDLMGNVDTNWHTYVQPNSPNTFTLKTAWHYDSWGRVQSITYPDREKVDYKYDFGGQLYSIDGYKSGHVGHTPYIREILYDHFGQRTQVIDGDDVKTTYDYNPATRRLAHLMNYSSVTGETLQDNLYYYDAVGNVDSIRDNGRNHRLQTYKYDDANRLVGSTGSMTQEYSTALPYSYESGYKYSPAGRFLNKYVDSKRLSTAMGPYPVRYDNEYSYTHPNNPYAVTHVQDAYGAHYDFDWDDNGNLTDSRAYATHTDRRLCWTEDNRLQAFMERGDEGGIAAWYNYSAEGERNIKLTSPRLNIQQNATLFNNPPLVYPTLYASSLVTLTKHGYTKHYFEEGRRICSKIGGGMHGNVTVEELDSRLPELAYNYDEQFHHQYDGIRHTFHDCIEADPQIIDGVNLHHMLVEREVQRDNDEPAFFYHGDHLGSAAYLTYHGGVVQTLNYLPYGEDWVELNFFAPHDTTRLGIYRFNGKEKDYESGFHYYGARYYWSEVLTGWLSVDPMMDKYPNISSYNYCVLSPVRLVDPNGESPVSMGAKFIAKNATKAAAKALVKNLVSNRLKNYASQKWAKQLLSDALTGVDIAMGQAWWEYAIEVIPVAGDAYGAYKVSSQALMVAKHLDHVERRINSVAKALNGRNTLRGAMGLTDVTKEAHHLIPIQALKESKVVQAAVEAGFEFNGKINGIALPKGHEPHLDYNRSVMNELQRWEKANPNYTPEMAKAKVEQLAVKLRNRLE